MTTKKTRTASPGPPSAVLAAAAVVAALFLAGCGSTRQPSAPAAEPAAPPEAAPPKPVPAMTLRVASLDVSRFSGKIEQKHVDELARLLGERKVDVLAVQGITRYPTLKTRVDLVEGLAASAGMRQAFGETISLSGRQSGNAVFSSYPVASSDSRGFEGVSGLNFEGALRVIVDAGTRPLVVVSTLLPYPLSAKDREVCLDGIAAMTAERGKDPLLVLGNLPDPPAGGWEQVEAPGTSGRAWITPGPVEAGPASVASCALGTLLILDLGIFPQGVR